MDVLFTFMVFGSKNSSPTGCQDRYVLVEETFRARNRGHRACGVAQSTYNPVHAAALNHHKVQISDASNRVGWLNHLGCCTISGNLEAIASLGIPFSFTPNSWESMTALAAAFALA